MDQSQTIANFKINTNSAKMTTISYVKVFLQKTSPDEAEGLTEKFTQNYEKALLLHEKEDQTDLARFYRLILEFKPALATILKPGREFDTLCDIVVQQFNVILNRVRRQINDDRPQKELMGENLPRKGQSIQLHYYCTVCKQSFEIAADVQKKLLNSDEKVPLPTHHEKEMVVQIGDPAIMQSQEKSPQIKAKIDVFPAELLMQHTKSSETHPEYLKLLSVGIVVGSSTTHLVFSRLTLKREQSFLNMSNRFVLKNREILYKGNIIFTPLLDPTTVDIEAVVKFCKEEYKKANLTPEQVDTGAVIVTGETAKKKNAVEIVQRLASETGKFVSATAGHNYESMLAAMGSGIVDLSLMNQNTILNVDIGGGTSKMAIASRGLIHSTSAINVGGRLLGIDKDFKIWRIDGPTKMIMKELDMNYKIGDFLPERDVQAIVANFAKILIEVMLGSATSPLAKKLMLTDDLDFSIPINAISFSGGVAELIYELRTEQIKGQIREKGKSTNPYNDIGVYLAEQILKLMEQVKIPIIEPEYKIRATVIGAGAFSLSISGSTCYCDPKIQLPLSNIPVVSIGMKFNEFLIEGEGKARKFKDKIALALSNYNLIEGVDNFALFFNDINIRANLSLFAKLLETALPNSFANNKLVVILLGFDGAKMLGLTIKKETKLQENLLCLDELFLEDGDWIDVGNPFGQSEAFPITVKSLVFNKNQDDIQINREKAQKSKTNIPTISGTSTLDPSTTTIPAGTIPNQEKIMYAFMQFRRENPGHDVLFILFPEGELEFINDKKFLTPSEAKKLYKAWKEHESAFFIGEKRFPIISWNELQFAAQSIKGKMIIVGSKTKTNRFVLMKVDPGTLWQPNIAALASKLVNEWAWNLI